MYLGLQGHSYAESFTILVYKSLINKYIPERKVSIRQPRTTNSSKKENRKKNNNKEPGIPVILFVRAFCFTFAIIEWVHVLLKDVANFS